MALGVGIFFDVVGVTFLGNLLIFIVLLVILNTYVLEGMIRAFQHRVLPWIMGHYETLLRWVLKGWRPVWMLIATFVLLILSFFIFVSANLKVVFFPSGDPNQIFVYLKLPVGTRC